MTLRNIKIIINNRNRLTTTKNMVDKLLSINPDEQIIIIDNGSTYPPLLEWYEYIMNSPRFWGKVQICFHKNEGHLALWATGLYKELDEYFVYTDADIILPEYLPMDWKEIMYNTMQEYPEYKKIALGLKIDDIPEYYRYKYQVIRNEGRWWLEQVEPNVYKADTDTTFALMKNFGDNCYHSLRLCRKDLICKHHGWYLNLEMLDEEEQFYLDNLQDTMTQYSKQHKNPEKYTDI